MKIGFTELILVAIVAFVVIGPDKLPEYARKLGKMLRELKKYTAEEAAGILPVNRGVWAAAQEYELFLTREE